VFVRLAVFLVLTSLVQGFASAGQVRLVNLEQMTERAARIFSGRCTSAQVVFDPALGQDVTLATFRVDRAIKGVTDRTVTVRMLGAAAVSGPSREGRDAASPFRKGEDVVLFLYGESARGLSAPVGLGQGHFRVVSDKQGRKHAVNEFGNRGLLSDLRPQTRVRLGRGPDRPEDGATPTRDDVLDPAGLLDAAASLVAAAPRR
jgi:hypothetical protein